MVYDTAYHTIIIGGWRMINTPASPKRPRVRWGYVLFATIFTILLLGLNFNNPAFLPDPAKLVGSLLAIVYWAVLLFSNLRTAFWRPPTSNDTPLVPSITVNQAQAPLVPALHQLPPPPADFTDRTADLAAILHDIQHGAVISGVRGMGGIGKTALALVIADRLKTQYPAAQFFINLRGASDRPLKPIDAMQSVIRAYHPTAKLSNDENRITTQYCSVLEGQRAIILLDDVKDTAQITPLLPPASCLALITTRNMFTVPGLHPRTLETLPLADACKLLIAIAPDLDGVTLNRAAAQELLVHQPEILHTFDAQNNKVQVVEVIAHFCGCLPLALRAAASLIAVTPNLTPLDYATQLRDERTRLSKIGKEGVEIDVEASLNLSYRQLSPKAKRVFRQLSVFPASFDAAAVEAVCEDPGHTHLTKLVQLSLVEYAPTLTLSRDNAKRPTGASRQTWAKPVAREGMAASALILRAVRGTEASWGGDRYRLHGLTRLFTTVRLAKCDKDCTAAARLVKCDEDCAAAHLRHAAHYKDVLATCDHFYLQGNDTLSQGLALFDREWPNIRAGQAWAAAHAEHDDEAAVICSDYPHSGTCILALRQHPRDQIKWLEQALAAARRLKNRADEGVHLGNLGLAYADLGEIRQAIERYEQALVITRDLGDWRGEVNALGNLGLAYANLGEMRKAIGSYEQQLVIARDNGDRRGEGNALGNLGNAYANLGEMRKAIEHHKLYRDIARASGDQRDGGNALDNIGFVYVTPGETRQAIEFYEQILAIYREIGDRRSEGVTLSNLGNAYFTLGETHQAIEYHEQYLAIARDIGDRRGESNALGNLGNAYFTLGETRRAIEFYKQHRDLARDLGDRRSEATALGSLGVAYAKLGETRQASEFYEQHRDLARDLGDRRGEDNALGNLGNAYFTLGETRRAIEFYKQHRDLARATGDRRGEGNALGNIGFAYADRGETRKAIEFYEQALGIARDIGDRRGEGITSFNMALALDKFGEHALAIAHAEAALKIYEEIENPNAERVRQQLDLWEKDDKMKG
jgi:tetratricopeptide (TPR) repeat protein